MSHTPWIHKWYDKLSFLLCVATAASGSIGLGTGSHNEPQHVRKSAPIATAQSTRSICLVKNGPRLARTVSLVRAEKLESDRPAASGLRERERERDGPAFPPTSNPLPMTSVDAAEMRVCACLPRAQYAAGYAIHTLFFCLRRLSWHSKGKLLGNSFRFFSRFFSKRNTVQIRLALGEPSCSLTSHKHYFPPSSSVTLRS